MLGEGPLAETIRQRLQAAGLTERVWLPGVRGDVADVVRAMDCFVLPSLFEATSCTLQEAMATGLNIVATDVGGNAALLENGRCGTLVPSEDADALAQAILAHYQHGLTKQSGLSDQAEAAMTAIQRSYGLDAVVARYRQLFLS